MELCDSKFVHTLLRADRLGRLAMGSIVGRDSSAFWPSQAEKYGITDIGYRAKRGNQTRGRIMAQPSSDCAI